MLKLITGFVVLISCTQSFARSANQGAPAATSSDSSLSNEFFRRSMNEDEVREAQQQAIIVQGIYQSAEDSAGSRVNSQPEIKPSQAGGTFWFFHMENGLICSVPVRYYEGKLLTVFTSGTNCK